MIKWKKIRVTGHLCGEFTGHWWSPRTKASDAEFWFFFISAYLSALEPQVAGIGSAGSIQHSSLRELSRATASPCLNTRGPEAPQNDPETNLDQSQLIPPLCCGRERQLLSGRKLSTLQLQLRERIIFWNYQIIIGIAKMTVPSSGNIISATGECFTRSFCLLSWPYVRHELSQPHRRCQSSVLTRSTAKLQNTWNNIKQICPITPSSHHTPSLINPKISASQLTQITTKLAVKLSSLMQGPDRHSHTHTHACG